MLSLQGYESTQLKLKVSRKGFRFLPEIIEKKIKLTINSDKEAVSTCWNQKQFGWIFTKNKLNKYETWSRIWKKKIKNEYIFRTSGIDILFSSKPQFTTSHIWIKNQRVSQDCKYFLNYHSCLFPRLNVFSNIYFFCISSVVDIET